MDRLHRLIVALFLLAASLPSYAFTNYEYSWANYTGYGTCAAVGAHYAAWETTNTTSTVTFEGCLTSPAGSAPWYTHVRLHYYADSNGADQGAVNRQINFRVVQACPANSTGTSGNCTCNAGFTQTTSADGTHSCFDPAAQECSTLAGTAPNTASCSGAYCSWYSAYPYPATSAGDPTGCLINPSGYACTISGDLDLAGPADGKTTTGPWVVRASNIKYTGSKCNAAAEPGPDDKPAGTKEGQLSQDNAGKCPGTVNGVEIWVPCSTQTSTKKTTENKTTTNPDGTTTTSTEGKTSTTECKSGVCTTTTTTTKTEDGQTTTTTGTSTAPKGEYCKQNASDPQCGDFSSWGGSCAAGFQCNGDAVMCAAAQAAWQQKCALVDGPASPTSEQQAYTAGKAGGEGYTVPVSGLSISSANFDSSNSLGVSGQCISDLPIVVWGNSISLPLSKVCPHLATLGTVMLAIAWLMAAVIVGKGVQG